MTDAPGEVRSAAALQKKSRPGFVAGFGSVFGGFGYLLRTPQVWPYAMVPALILTLLVTIFGWISIGWIQPALLSWVGEGSSWYGRLGSGFVSWFGAVLSLVAGILLALVLSPPLSGPALEKIVDRYERELGVPTRAPTGILQEIWCGVRAQLFAAIFLLPVLAVLWVIGLLFPPATVVTVPLEFLCTGLALSWNLFDYPLTLRGIRMRDRFNFVLRAKAATLGFGLAFALLFWIPCFNVFLLPVGVAAATRLVWRLVEYDPSLMPGLQPREPSNSPAQLSQPGAGSTSPTATEERTTAGKTHPLANSVDRNT